MLIFLVRLRDCYVDVLVVESTWPTPAGEDFLISYDPNDTHGVQLSYGSVVIRYVRGSFADAVPFLAPRCSLTVYRRAMSQQNIYGSVDMMVA